MKKIILVSVLFLYILACSEKPEENYILFSGKISNPISKEISLRKTKFGERGIEKKITLDTDGFFNDTIRLGSGHYSFDDSKNRMSLYLVNGGKIHLTYDGNNFRSSAKFSGKYSESSKYILLKKEQGKKLTGDPTEFYAKTESEFLKHSKFIKDSLNTLLDSFNDIPEAFLEEERKELKYRYLADLVNYEKRHGLAVYEEKHGEYNGINDKILDFKVSDDFLTELKDIDFDNEEDFSSSYYYRELVSWHYEDEVNELAKKEDNDVSLAKMKVYATIPNDLIRNNLLVGTSMSFMGDTKKLDEFYQIFQSYALQTRFSDIIKEKYNKLKKLSKGTPSPIFTDYINHAGGKTSLDDLKGKYVYIDIWATWCVPCLKEVPFLEKVEKEFHDKDIHFVSISIDNDKAFDKWKKMVTDKNMTGIQLIADNSWSSSFIDGYQLSGVPRFILLDPEAKIVTAYAPRPSDPSLVDLLKELKI
ncbi:MAG: TlpA disulfide reductase family protein [Flavobacteriaceae bacterium]